MKKFHVVLRNSQKECAEIRVAINQLIEQITFDCFEFPSQDEIEILDILFKVFNFIQPNKRFKLTANELHILREYTDCNFQYFGVNQLRLF